MHFDGKMKSNRRKIERGLGILPYGNSTTQTIGKCGRLSDEQRKQERLRIEKNNSSDNNREI